MHALQERLNTQATITPNHFIRHPNVVETTKQVRIASIIALRPASRSTKPVTAPKHAARQQVLVRRFQYMPMTNSPRSPFLP